MTPGQKIVEEAFDAYARWEHRYAEDLEDVEIQERPAVYSYFCRGSSIDEAKIMAEIDRRAHTCRE